MLRIKRDENVYSTPEFEQNLEHELHLLQRHLPPSIVQLYAVPNIIKSGQGSTALEWLSAVSGTITPYAQLDGSAQRAIRDQMEAAQRSVAALQHELARQQRTEDAAALQPLLQTPAPEQLYAINGKPVITNWKPTPQDPATAALAPAVATASAASSATAATATGMRSAAAAPGVWRRRIGVAFLLLLLLGILALTAVSLYRLWPFDFLAKPSDAIPFEENYACSAAANDEQAPELSVIFDTSDSMNLNIHTSTEDEDWFYEIGYLLGFTPRTQRLLSAPSRFDIARPALLDMLANVHPNIPIRLTTFNSCDQVVDHGVFDNHQRTQLQRAIQRLDAEGPTPSALALQHAASRMDGKAKDGIIVMFIDGEDGCGGNICQVAQAIAEQQPRLRINVVDIGDSGRSSCVAEHTGGRVYASTDVVEIGQLLRLSTEEVAVDAACGGAASTSPD